MFDAFRILFILNRFAVGDPLGLWVTGFGVLGFAELPWHLLPARMRPSRLYTVTDLEKTARSRTEMSRARDTAVHADAAVDPAAGGATHDVVDGLRARVRRTLPGVAFPADADPFRRSPSCL